MNIQIDSEFKSLIPPPTLEEYQQLEANILVEGCRDPLVLWNGVLIDGHNRYEICRQHRLSFSVTDREFSDRAAVKAWIIRNQFGRRNLSSSQRAVLALELEKVLSVEAKTRQGERNDLKSDIPQIIAESSGGESRQQAATAAGTNRQYVSDAKKIERKAPELLEKIMQGEMTLPEAKELARQEPQRRERAIEMLETGQAGTVREAVSVLNREERVEKIQQISTGNQPLVTGAQHFPVIYADPPWRYEHMVSRSREIENHYPTMELEEICVLPVGSLATPDAILFLWVTSPKLEDGFKVMNAWGFHYRTCGVWVKDKIGMGYYLRQRHELLLIGVRGKMVTPKTENRFDSVIEAPVGLHSAKPDSVYEMIEIMYPEFQKIELFCRSPREGWHVWGNQAHGRVA